MDLGIRGRVAFVMGGTRGIGRAIAEILAAEGCAVAVVGRDDPAARATAGQISASGGTAFGLGVDMTAAGSAQSAVAQVEQELGPVDIAVYNGVTPRAGGFEDVSDSDLEESFRMTVIGFANLVRAVSPGMKERQWGRVLTIGSRTVKQPLRSDELPYVLANTTRIAAVGLSKTLANELGPFGITVNTIGTGRIATESYDDYTAAHSDQLGTGTDDFLNDKIRRIPLRRFGKPAEIASLAAFLCSQNGGYVSGETINCDGGRNESMF
ncbi:MAG: SDR family oxidoreductase [Ilumatobacteraceae bacterium]